MSICYWCHWGWPKPIRDIYDRADKALNGNADVILNTLARTVWENENFDDFNVRRCIYEIEMGIPGSDGYRREDQALVVETLRELLLVPGEMRQPPEDFEESDGEHPENFPPPTHRDCGEAGQR
jgi:hypothetical protein